MQQARAYLTRLLPKAVTLTVVASLFCDPLWASGISTALAAEPIRTSSHPDLFLTNALVAREVAARWTNRLGASLQTLRQAGGLARVAQTQSATPRRTPGLLRFLTASTLALAQLVGVSGFAADESRQSSKPKEPKRPRVERPFVPQVSDIQRQNTELLDASLNRAWHFGKADLNQVRGVEDLLPLVIQNSPKVGEKFLEHRESWQNLLAILQNQGKYRTVDSDRLHGLGPAIVGSHDVFGDVLAYPDTVTSDPQSQVQLAEKGGGLWGTLFGWATRLLFGVKIYSKNQVEASYLKQFEQIFVVQQAYADLEQTIYEQHAAAVSAWLSDDVKTRHLSELRDQVWIPQRAWERKMKTAGDEGVGPEGIGEIDEVRSKYLSQFTAAMGDRSTVRTRLFTTLVNSPNDIAGASSWEPKRPSGRLISSDTEPLDPRVQTALARFGQPLEAPENFLPAGRAPGWTEPSPQSEESLKTFLARTADVSDMGASPYQRRLELLRSQWESVRITALQIQKETKTRFGIHVPLGTLPLIAALLDFSVSKPDPSTLRSVDDMIQAARLEIAAIDERIQAEQIRWTGEYEAARQRGIAASVGLDVTRLQMEVVRKQMVAASLVNSPYLSADPATRYLEMQLLKKTAARQLTEVWAATEQMKLYTAEGQRRVVDETRAHYVQVLDLLDPSAKAHTPGDINPDPLAKRSPGKKEKKTEKPKKDAAKIRGFVLPAALAALGSALGPGLGTAHAHTFAPQAGATVSEVAKQAAAAAVSPGTVISDVAMQVTFQAYKGGAENTLSGVAVDILRARGQPFTQKDIWDTVQQIAKEANIADINKVLRDHTYTIGSYSPDVAQQLGMHHSGISAAPHIQPVATPSPMPIHTPTPAPVPTQTPTPVPTPASTPTPAPTSTPEMSAAAQHPMDAATPPVDASGHESWISLVGDWATQSNLHMVILVAGVLLAAGLVTWFAVSWSRRGRFNSNGYGSPGYQPFSVNERSEALPFLNRYKGSAWILFALFTLGIGACKFTLPLLAPSFPSAAVISGWSLALLPAAAIAFFAAIIGRKPTLRREPYARWLLAPVVTIIVAAMAFANPSFPWRWLPLLLGSTWAVFQMMVQWRSQIGPNVLYRVGRHRLGRAVLLALSLPIFASTFFDRVAKPVWSYGTDRTRILVQRDALEANYGNSVAPVRPQISWMPPESGVVRRVHFNSPDVKAHAPVVVYDPLSPSLLNQLKSIRARLQAVLKTSPLSADLIDAAAATYPGAPIHIEGSFEGSVDEKISEALTESEHLLMQYDKAKARAEQTALVSGVKATSFDEKEFQVRLRETGERVEGYLSERQSRNVSAGKDGFRVFLGKGVISEGTELHAGRPVTLFTHELSEYRLLQLRLTLPDALALARHWRASEVKDLSMRFKDQSHREVALPFSDIVEFLPPEDASLPRREDLWGPTFRNPVSGIAREVVVALAVKSNRLFSEGNESLPYQFTGFYHGDQRLLEPEDGKVILGNAELIAEATAQPPHQARLGALQQQWEAKNKLIAGLEALRREIETHQQNYPDSEWAANKLFQLKHEVDALKGKAHGLSLDIDRIEQSGQVSAGHLMQPEKPLAFTRYPLVRTFQVDRLKVLGPEVRVQVSFYSTASHLRGNRVQVKSASHPEPLEFEIIEPSSLERQSDLGHYRAEATLPRDQALKLFPPNLPMTQGMVEVRAIPSSAEAPGPSRLTYSELLTGLGVAVLAPGIGLGYSYGFWYTALPLVGYLSAVFVHEWVGHRRTARQQNREVRLGFDRLGLLWREKVNDSWKPLFDYNVQRAGPTANLWALGYSLAGAVALPLLGGLGVPTMGLWMILIPFLVSNGIFQQADRWVREPRPKEVPTEPVTSLALAERWVQPHRFTPEKQESAYLTSDGLVKYLKDLEETALEEERNWRRGDPTTYLTTWQHLTHWFRDKIPLTERMVFFRRYHVDSIEETDASRLELQYRLKESEAIAASKTRTFLMVYVVMGVLASFVAFASAGAVSQFIRGIYSNPFIMPFVGPGLIGTALFMIIFFGGGLLINLSESWSKFIATLPWNARYLSLRARGMIDNVSREFVEKTSEDPMAVYQKIYKTRILRFDTRARDEFMGDFSKFARQIADRTYDHIAKEPFDEPTEGSLAFMEAFRIQVRKSRDVRSPLYEGMSLELANDEWHFGRLEKLGEISASDSLEKKYRMLTCSRVDEVKTLMQQYPVHTLMALLRSGNLEVLADIDEMPHPEKVLKIVEAIKERMHTLDPDVFDNIRAQARIYEFFEILHYAFEGLRVAVQTGNVSMRKDVLDYWERAVTPFEREIWNQFVKDVDALMNEQGKEKSQIIDDQNRVLGIAYTLTMRRRKEEGESKSKEFVSPLRNRLRHSRRKIMEDRYLRGPAGTSGTRGPTTSLLQLNTAYLKYYDLLAEWASRFPHAALFGDSDIYLTCENTINFRQTLREMALWLKLTRGHVILVDASEMHPRFADLIDDALPARIGDSRVRVETLEGVRKRLATDRSAIVISSAIPLEWWNVLDQSAGVRAHVGSPLLNPLAAFLAALNTHPEKVDKLFSATRRRLKAEEARLHQRQQHIERELNIKDIEKRPGDTKGGWPALRESGTRHRVAYPPVRTTHRREVIKEIRSGISIMDHKQKLEQQQQEKEELDRKLAHLAREISDLDRIKSEINNVPHFLRGIGIHPDRFTDDDSEERKKQRQMVHPDHINDGQHDIGLFTQHPKTEAEPEPPTGRLIDFNPRENPSTPPKTGTYQRSLQSSA